MTRSIVQLLFATVLFSCSATRRTTGDDGKIEVRLIQVNDVYEIAPLSGGKEGGMARVASIKKKHLALNPNSFLIIAGDFLSPSVYNSLPYEGKAIRGRQMIEAMNAAGMDIAIFGNHEFDIREAELQERINESNFIWVSSNSFHRIQNEAVPFVKNGHPIPRTWILRVRDADGTTARIGLMGICLPFNKAPYVHYNNPLSAAREMYLQLVDSVDAVVALTHQAMAEDRELAHELPALAAILGGHEHDQHFETINGIPVTKALANAKSAWVVTLRIDKKARTTIAEPFLEKINEAVPFDSVTQAVVEKWTAIADQNYRSLGFNATEVVLKQGVPLDGREAEVRRESTGLTKLITTAMETAAPIADVVLLNAGSIRVDDVLYPPVTQYDIIRTLPFGGGIREVDMKGSLLITVLDKGQGNRGSGGFLHSNVEKPATTWMLKGKAIDPEAIYRVAMTEFLLTGMEANLDMLKPGNPGITKLYEAPKNGDLLFDIRTVVIDYLKKRQITD
jgi:2',3'-cyclic-nucleotide 2'-phosphodiesterase (5'-nucleotidase family)